jgi:hypothetical protein
MTSYRYERKFVVDRIDRHQVMGLIKRHPAMFYQPYPPRINNNLYMDTADMVNYQDNVVGSADRRKVRIRWYGDLMGLVDEPVLEFKIKRGLVGTKRQYRVPGFAVEHGLNTKDLMRRTVASDLPPEVRSYLRTVNIVLMNNYQRRYFVSRDGRFRLTLDTRMAYYRIGGMSSWMARKQTDQRNVILELKYGIDDDAAASKVSTFFPFRVTKSSKYVQGIERVYM